MSHNCRHSLDSVRGIVKRCAYKDWVWRVEPLGDGFFVQCVWDDVDNNSGEPCTVRGAKHYISAWATDDEIVKRCWVVVRDALMHEAMECFLLDGVAPFNPHNDVFSMLTLPRVNRIDNNPVPRPEVLGE